MQSKNLLKTTNLKVCYAKKKNKTVLIDSFNFEFKPNKVYFILGKMGVGKTTLVSHFNGLVRSDKGEIQINNNIITSSKKKIKNVNDIRKDIQILFQFIENQIFKNSVIDDVCFGPKNFNIKNSKALAKQLLNKLGFNNDDLLTPTFDLSNGQKKKVALAGILAINPNIFIFDEPTANLDANGVETIKKLIKQLKTNNKIVIVISHNTDLALELADELLLINNKQVISDDNVFDFFNNKNNLLSGNLSTPHVIDIVKKLNISSLAKAKPRNIDQLANAINSWMKGGK